MEKKLLLAFTLMFFISFASAVYEEFDNKYIYLDGKEDLKYVPEVDRETLADTRDGEFLKNIDGWQGESKIDRSLHIKYPDGLILDYLLAHNNKCQYDKDSNSNWCDAFLTEKLTSTRNGESRVELNKDTAYTYYPSGGSPDSATPIETTPHPKYSAIVFSPCSWLGWEEISCGGFNIGFKSEWNGGECGGGQVEGTRKIESVNEPIQMGVYVDPKWAEGFAKSIDEGGRGFRPGMNPFANIICEVKALECGKVKDKLGEARLIVVKEDGSDGPLLASGKLDLVGKEKDSPWVIYQWKIPGWYNGWTTNEQAMEELLKSGRARCEVKVKREKYELPPLKYNFGVGKCTQIFGYYSNNPYKPFKYVFKRDETSDLSSRQLVSAAENARAQGFNKIDPFEEYKDRFSLYVDLEKKENPRYPNGGILNWQDKAFEIALDEGNCGEARINFMHSNSVFPIFKVPLTEASAFTDRLSHVVFVNPQTALFPGEENAQIYTHESGHAFCDLDDEYLKFAVNGPNPDYGWTNCLASGAAFWPWGNSGNSGCNWPNLFRASASSLMKGDASKFNVMSCGYCNYHINRGSIYDRL